MSYPEQTQESMQSFEKKAGLTDAGYKPHKGLAADESHYHRMAQSMQVRIKTFVNSVLRSVLYCN